MGIEILSQLDSFVHLVKPAQFTTVVENPRLHLQIYAGRTIIFTGGGAIPTGENGKNSANSLGDSTSLS